MKYEVECTWCQNKQIYKPKKKLPKNPHTVCSHCKKDFYIKPTNSEEIIDVNPSKNGTRKGRLKQPLKLDKAVKELDAETIEKLIVKALNEYKNDVQVLKLAVDYYTRIKINQGESMDLIDMKEFLKIGATVAYDPTDI